MKSVPVSFINRYTLSLNSPLQIPLPAKPHRKPWPRPQNESPPIAMSVSCSNCLSDSILLCGEDSSGVLSGESPECSSDLDSSPPSEEDSIAGFIEDERHFVPGFEYLNRFQSRTLDASAREESVAWILKVTISPALTVFLTSPDTLLCVYYDITTRVEYQTRQC